MYIHATNKKNSQKIIASQHIKPSKSNVYDFFEEYIDRIDNILQSDDGFSKIKDFNLTLRPHYCYLGHGVYCFHKKDLAVAKEYDPSKQSLVEIQLKKKTEKILDLNNPDNLDELISNIQLKFPISKNPDYEQHFLLFKKILHLNLLHLRARNSDCVPFSIGISLDILKYDKKFNLIYLTFPKKEADYVVIKDISVINSLSLIS